LPLTRDRTPDILGHRARRACKRLNWRAIKKIGKGFTIVDAATGSTLFGVGHDLTAGDVLGIVNQEEQRQPVKLRATA
jgi:hypothetical protein